MTDWQDSSVFIICAWEVISLSSSQLKGVNMLIEGSEILISKF